MKYLITFENYNTTPSHTPMDFETELNVVDTINRNDITGNVPLDAQYAKLNPSGEFIEKFYKFKEVNFNDGEVKKILNFWGEQGGWYPSSYNDKESNDYTKLKDAKFLKIID